MNMEHWLNLNRMNLVGNANWSEEAIIYFHDWSTFLWNGLQKIKQFIFVHLVLCIRFMASNHAFMKQNYKMKPSQILFHHSRVKNLTRKVCCQILHGINSVHSTRWWRMKKSQPWESSIDLRIHSIRIKCRIFWHGITKIVPESRLKWYGHVLRRENE